MLGKNQFGFYDFEKVKENIEKNSKLKVEYSEYKNQSSKLNIKCECGENFSASYRKLRENNFRTKCKQCRVKEATEKRLESNKMKFLEFMKNVDDYELLEYRDARKRSKFIHTKCGIVFETRTQTFKEGARCPCESSSRGERKIIDILQSNNIEYKKEFSFDDCKSFKNFPLRFDFAIFKNKKLILLIEFNGIQHYKDDNWLNNKNGINDRQINDWIKINYCNKKGIPLLIIPYNKIKETEQIIFNMLISIQATESHKSK